VGLLPAASAGCLSKSTNSLFKQGVCKEGNAEMKRVKKRQYDHAQLNQRQAMIAQARRAWEGKRVQVQLAAIYGYDCVCSGVVGNISNTGDVVVMLDPGSPQVAVVCSLGMASRVLTLVE
jgi:hypothetical protein